MFAALCACLLLLVAIGDAEYQLGHDVTPSYIKKALLEKQRHKPLSRQRKKTFRNITMREVFDKIKSITSTLNQDAKRNGYYVDYKIRIFS